MNKTVEYLKNQKGKKILKSPSPAGNWLQPVLLDAEEGFVKAEIKIRHEMTNPAGTLHGGIIALIADEITGVTIATLDLPDFYPSVNLYTDFLSGVKEGEKIIAEAQIVRKGKNIINTECKFIIPKQNN